jgi:hypothetical protein
MTPQNAGYYYAAYVVLGVLYAGYVLSLWWRAKKQGPTDLGT